MSTELLTDEIVEEPFWFRAGDDELFGMLTRPGDAVPEVAVVVAAGGWHGTSTARNGSVVQICRALARAGVAACHFDYRGVGESTGVAAFSLTAPYTADLVAAVTSLRDRGVRRVALVGICYGSWVALLAARDVADLDALVLVSFPPSARGKRLAARVDQAAATGLTTLVRRGLGPAGRRGLLHDAGVRRAARRAVVAKLRGLTSRAADSVPDVAAAPESSALVVSALDDVTARGVPLLFLYSDRAPHHAEFLAARADGPLGPPLARAGDGCVDVVAVDSDIEEFTRLNAQQALTGELVDWLTVRLQHP